MKINRLEAHDRLIYYKNDQKDIGQHVQECINNVPEAIRSPFYVYGHTKSLGLDEKIALLSIEGTTSLEKRFIWMPRITKPLVSANTYLFLARKGSDVVQTIWAIPVPELWDQFAPGKMMHDEVIWDCICQYIRNPNEFNNPDPRGPNLQDQEEWFRIYGEESRKRKNMKQAMLKTSEEFPVS